MMLHPNPVDEMLNVSAESDAQRHFDPLSDDGKQALIELGFVPTYEQLRYLKSHSGLEIALVGVQAAGYLLGILERMAADQRISPIEALSAFFGILMIFLALLQWFACPGYKRTVLFHLDPRQYSLWKSRVQAIPTQTFRSDEDKWSDLVNILVILLMVLIMLLSLVPAIYFAIDFLKPHHRCLICFIPALFFSLNLILILPAALIVPKTTAEVAYIGTSLLWLLNVSSIVVAVIATILEWEDQKFNQPTKSWYRWLIPHIGT